MGIAMERSGRSGGEKEVFGRAGACGEGGKAGEGEERGRSRMAEDSFSRIGWGWKER